MCKEYHYRQYGGNSITIRRPAPDPFLDDACPTPFSSADAPSLEALLAFASMHINEEDESEDECPVFDGDSDGEALCDAHAQQSDPE